MVFFEDQFPFREPSKLTSPVELHEEEDGIWASVLEEETQPLNSPSGPVLGPLPTHDQISSPEAQHNSQSSSSSHVVTNANMKIQHRKSPHHPILTPPKQALRSPRHHLLLLWHRLHLRNCLGVGSDNEPNR